MSILHALLGAVVLFFGRALYWAFIAIAGFLVGFKLAGTMLVDQPTWVLLLAGVGAGVVGALLAMLAQRVAFGLAGFLAGGYLAVTLAEGLQGGGDPRVWFVVGGVVAGILAVMIMDWALVVLSSLLGAALITAAVPLDPLAATLLFVLLAAAGMFVQGARLRAPRPAPPPP